MHVLPILLNLENQFMRSHSVGDGESGLQVLSQQFDLLDVSQQGSINSSLGLLLFSESGLFFFGFLLSYSLSLINYLLSSSSEESFFRLLLSLDLKLLEVVVVDVVELNSSKVNFIRSGDDGRLIDSSKGNTVDLVGTGDQQESRLELSKENNSLTLESADEENQDLTRSDILSERSRLSLDGGSSGGSWFVISRVPLVDGLAVSSVGLLLITLLSRHLKLLFLF